MEFWLNWDSNFGLWCQSISPYIPSPCSLCSHYTDLVSCLILQSHEFLHHFYYTWVIITQLANSLTEMIHFPTLHSIWKSESKMFCVARGFSRPSPQSWGDNHSPTLTTLVSYWVTYWIRGNSSLISLKLSFWNALQYLNCDTMKTFCNRYHSNDLWQPFQRERNLIFFFWIRIKNMEIL